MQFYKSKTNLIPLSTSYVGDADINFIKNYVKTEEGFEFFSENYLKEALDNKINNYSSLYLTNERKFGELAEIILIQNPKTNHFTTTIYQSNTDQYLTCYDLGVNQLSAFTTKTEAKFLGEYDRLFDINIVNSEHCNIIHSIRKVNYYLSCNSLTNFGFLTAFSEEKCNFKYFLDEKSNKLVLFKALSGSLYILNFKNGLINLSQNISSYKDYSFDINYYIQDIYPKFDTSWVSYDTTHKNSYSILKNRSTYGLKNNYLVSTQYSYITSSNIEANIMILKNQISNTNYSYRGDYLSINNFENPSVQFRRYNKLFTGNNQELGFYNISLNYQFYNTDFKLNSDEYTTIKVSDSLYPYKQININDLNWSKSGSIAGDNPYMSDKIFFNQAESIYGSKYVCTWLCKDKNGDNIWLDRYYKPEVSDLSQAYQSVFDRTYTDDLIDLLDRPLNHTEYYDVPDIYNTVIEEYNHTPQTVRDALYGIPIFDKVSDFLIKPNKEYIYFRVGNLYIKQILNSLSANLIENGLSLTTSNGNILVTDTNVDTETYSFDGTRYAHIDNYTSVNENTHSYTISLFIKSDNWNDYFGYQIFGNVSNKGIGFISDGKITPFITIQNGSNVYVYNTDFNLVDSAVLSSESLGNFVIKDIQRGDHLDSYNVITNPYIIS